MPDAGHLASSRTFSAREAAETEEEHAGTGETTNGERKKGANNEWVSRPLGDRGGNEGRKAQNEWKRREKGERRWARGKQRLGRKMRGPDERCSGT